VVLLVSGFIAAWHKHDSAVIKRNTNCDKWQQIAVDTASRRRTAQEHDQLSVGGFQLVPFVEAKAGRGKAV